MLSDVRFSLRGDTLILNSTAHGVALDGGDLIVPAAAVRIEGRAFKWEVENQGGGHVVTTARITGDGRIVGDEQIVGGHKLPEGFKVPEVTIEMKRARGTVTVR